MKKIILIIFVVLIAGCGNKKEEKLDFKCIKSIVNENYTYREVIGYYSFEDGEPSKILYMEDYIPSNKEGSLALINGMVSKKKSSLNKYKNMVFNQETKNSKIYVDYTIDLVDENIKLLKKDEKYKNYVKKDMFKADKFIEDLVINEYTCE